MVEDRRPTIAGIVIRQSPVVNRKWIYADYQSARARRAQENRQQDQESGPAKQPAEAGRVRPRFHADAEEAQLRAAQGGTGAPHQRHRGDDIYSGRRPQPAGALAGAHSRRPRQGSSRRPLPRRPRDAGCGGCPGPDAGAIEVRRQTAEESVKAHNPRTREIPKRDVTADPTYQSPYVSKLIN